MDYLALIDSLLNSLFWLFLIASLVCGATLIYLGIQTKKVTEFLNLTNWFGVYTKITQRGFSSYIAFYKYRKEYSGKPIRELLSKFNFLFQADFEKLFEKLQPSVHYRVTTHYKAPIEKAVADGKIKLLSSVPQKEKRFLHELLPLLGFSNYRIMRKCVLHCPSTKRCCAKCRRYEKCQCRRGGSCPKVSEKVFVRYDFLLITDENIDASR